MTHLKNSFIYRPYRISFSEKKLVQGQRESPPVSSSACQAPLCTLKSNSTWNLRRQARRERGQRPTRPAATRPRQDLTNNHGRRTDSDNDGAPAPPGPRPVPAGVSRGRGGRRRSPRVGVPDDLPQGPPQARRRRCVHYVIRVFRHSIPFFRNI